MAPIALLPVLALFGVFGPQTNSARAETGGVEMTVEYPSRLRYDNRDRLYVTVTNRSAVANDVSVHIDPSWLEAYADVLITPAPDAPYTIEFEDVGPGESREVAVEVRAKEYGQHTGSIAFVVDGRRGEIDLETFIFP